MQNADIEELKLNSMRLFGLPVAKLNPDEFIQTLGNWAEDKPPQSKVVGYLNAHIVNLVHRDANFRRAMEGMSLIYADGMSIVRHSERIGSPLPDRVNAGDFLIRFLWSMSRRGVRIALVGSEKATVERCAATLQDQVPGLRFCFVHHGHFLPDGPEEAKLLSELEDSKADIVLLGMGSPRQECWAMRHRSDTGASVLWCVGALFEYFGSRRRAPVWMREAGLEWIFRLVLEPKRLAARYLLGNVEFLWRARNETRRLSRH